MKSKLILTCLLILPSVHAKDSNFSKPIGASQARIWNWILANENGAPREKPVLGAAKCDFDEKRILANLGLPSKSLFIGNSVVSQFDIAKIENLQKKYPSGENIVNCTPIQNPINLSSSLDPLSPLGKVWEESRQALEQLRNKTVFAYGSDKIYVSQDKSDFRDAHNLIALQMADKCIRELKQNTFKFTNLINRENLLTALRLKPVSALEIKLNGVDKKVDENIDLSKGIQNISGKSVVLAQGYSYTEIPINYNLEQREKIYQYLSNFGSCAIGERWIEQDGASADKVLPNKCNKKYEKLEKKIASLEGGTHKFLKNLFGAIGCGIGRRLEGGGILNTQSGTGLGALACGLTEVINGYGCESALKIMKNVATSTLGAFLGGSVPNGSALGDYAYNGGGINYRERPVDRINSNSGKSLLGGVAGEGGRDIIRQFFTQGHVNFAESVRNGAIGPSLYHASPHLSDDRAQFLGIDGFDGISNNEYLSGGFRGYLTSEYRIEKCIDKVYDDLSHSFNKSDAPRLNPVTIAK